MSSFKKFISPIASGIAIIAFFMPWASCNEINISGSQLAKDEPLLWVVLAVPILSIAVYSLFFRQKRIEKSKSFIIFSSIAALIIMIFKYFDLFSKQNEYYTIKIKYGFILSVLALLSSMLGGFLIKPLIADNLESSGKESPVSMKNSNTETKSVTVIANEDPITVNLRRLENLKNKGLLTDEEFQEKRKSLLEQI